MSLLKTNEIQNYNGSSLTLTASTVSTSAQLNTGGNISVTGSLNVSDDSTTRTNLGLGSMATQNANSVAITGGTINTVQPATGQSLTIKDEDGNTAITIGTDNTAASYLNLNFGSYNGGSGTLTGSSLSDFEEGTWTPAFSGATFSTSSVGVYVKVGTLVTVHASISATYSSPIGSFKINNLPFTVFNNSARSGADPVCCQSGITFTGYVTLECIENTTEAFFEDNKSGLSRADMNSSNFASPFSVRFTATYRSST